VLSFLVKLDVTKVLTCRIFLHLGQDAPVSSKTGLESMHDNAFLNYLYNANLTLFGFIYPTLRCHFSYASAHSAS